MNKIKKICFFNHYHNGDLFHSKSFIRQIINTLDVDFSYAHSNNPKILIDLEIPYENIPDISHSIRFLEDGETLYINTWIGSYFVEGERYYGECTLRFSYDMFDKIYSELNSRFECNLSLSDIKDYYPSIDYQKFEIKNIDEYLKNNTTKKVLFSNGPCLSGQCRYYGDMVDIINDLAEKHKDITFICTQKIQTSYSNVVFTEDIIKISDNDLNEIGYLSTFCDLIVGRNSGPFCFSTNKDNVNNSNVTFYAFGEDIKTCFLYEIDIECNFVFEYFSNLESIKTTIQNIILNK